MSTSLLNLAGQNLNVAWLIGIGGMLLIAHVVARRIAAKQRS